MSLESIEPVDITDLRSPYFCQTAAWAHVKHQFGWLPIVFKQHHSNVLQPYILVLVKKISALGYLGYIPDGVLNISQHSITQISDWDALQPAYTDAVHVLQRIFQYIHDTLGKHVFTLRWDVPWCGEYQEKYIKTQQLIHDTKEIFTRLNTGNTTIRLGHAVQPSATVILPLHKGEQALLQEMKSKTRYNIRLAEKRGVIIKDNLNIKDFYQLYKTTSSRNRIAIHTEHYYHTVHTMFSKAHESDIKIYGAEYQNTCISAIVVLWHSYGGSKRAVYLYGASSKEHKNVMAPYLLQWRAITDAIDAGYEHYDLFGMSTTADSTHHMHGLYKFKTGFSTTLFARPFTLDIVPSSRIKRIPYTMFYLAEAMRYWYHHKYNKKH